MVISGPCLEYLRWSPLLTQVIGSEVEVCSHHYLVSDPKIIHREVIFVSRRTSVCRNRDVRTSIRPGTVINDKKGRRSSFPLKV